MSGHRHGYDSYEYFSAGYGVLKDPGDTGTLKVENQNGQMCQLVSAGTETRTLQAPTVVGLSVTVCFQTDGGTVTMTVTGGYNQDADTTMAFSDAGDYATFIAINDNGTLRWQVINAVLGSTVTYLQGSSLDVDSLSIGGTAVAATAAELNAAADVSARLVDVGDADYTVLVANSGKPHVIANVSADRTITMPAEASGLDYTFIADAVVADGHDWIFDTGSNTNFFTGGVLHVDTDANSAGDEIVFIGPDGDSESKLQVNLPSGGTWVRFICDGTTWTVTGTVVSATAPAFSDQ